jgi:hypothetical protein
MLNASVPETTDSMGKPSVLRFLCSHLRKFCMGGISLKGSGWFSPQFSLKSLQPLLALVSYETDEEQCRAFESLQVTINLSIDSLQVNI